MDLKLDDGLKTLIESGKEKGYLTYDQVNEFLPDDAVNPEKLDRAQSLRRGRGRRGGDRRARHRPRLHRGRSRF